ncbi:MAG: aldo/keto reductase [Phaeodactylibacter sp.]|nr:aldo/keto reductase [Phaeodactylibacter sp.]
MDLYLGTAFWGWTLPKATCFELLDRFYEAGFRYVDTATNYPINKIPGDFRKAEQWLLEWIDSRAVQDLHVCIKVGSINNEGTPDNLLSKSFLLMNLDLYQHRFGDNLHTFMIHWDNRDDLDAIEESLEALQIAQEKGLQPGLSGIRFPGNYLMANAKPALDFHIQIKHNLLQSAYAQYRPFHGKPRFITYGINAGGIKLDGSYTGDSTLKTRGGDPAQFQARLQQLRQLCVGLQPPLIKMFQVGMLYAFHHPDVRGILVGPSNLQQLESTLDWYKALQSGQYQSHFQLLQDWTEK